MMSSYWPDDDQPSVSRMMWRRVERASSSDWTAWSRPAKMFVLPSGLMPAIWPWRLPSPPSGCGPYDPVGRLVEGDDAQLVLRGHRGRRTQDRLLADVDLAHAPYPGPAAHPAAVERVAVAGVHGARLVDDDDERDVGLLLPVAHAHVDRQGLLERRLLVAARAEALRLRRSSRGRARGPGRKTWSSWSWRSDRRIRGTSTRTMLS